MHSAVNAAYVQSHENIFYIFFVKKKKKKKNYRFSERIVAKDGRPNLNMYV